MSRATAGVLKVEENQVVSLWLEQSSLVGLLRDCYTKYGWYGDFLLRIFLYKAFQISPFG